LLSQNRTLLSWRMKFRNTAPPAFVEGIYGAKHVRGRPEARAAAPAEPAPT